MVKPFFGLFVITLLTIPYLLLMSIVEFNGPPYLSLDVSQTRESTKWLWVGVVESHFVSIASTHGHIVLYPISLA